MRKSWLIISLIHEVKIFVPVTGCSKIFVPMFFIISLIHVVKIFFTRYRVGKGDELPINLSTTGGSGLARARGHVKSLLKRMGEAEGPRV